MAKFDSDFAIFGTFAADVKDDTDIGASVISYVNKACTAIYGDLRGLSVYDVLCEVTDSAEKANELVAQLKEKGSIVTEGKLNKRFITYHSRLVESPNGEFFIQTGITDMTESVTLKSRLYGTSEALKRAAAAADEDTGNHIIRINYYSGHLAKLKGMTQNFVEDISKYAQLHDIGKIKVAELIRLPRKLTDDEFNEVKMHTVFGWEIVEGLDGLEMAGNITLDHHEKWNGAGYPSGKSAEQISLEGRIVTIADIFDALVSERPYKPGLDYKTTYQIFLNGDHRVSPQHFDPEIYRTFMANYDDFVELHKKLKD